MATNAQVRALTTAQPFRPYRVRLADGRQFEVRHPESISCSPNGREMVVHDDEGLHLVEQLLEIELAPIEWPASARRKKDGK